MTAAQPSTTTHYLAFAKDDPRTFALGLQIPSATGPRLFAECIEPFQEEAFAALSPSLVAVRNGTMPPIRRFWVERTKGAAKDADLAIYLLWLLAFPKRPLFIPISAANQDQAGIVKLRANDILFYNGWLNGLVRIQQNRILSTAMRPNGKPLAEVKIEATGSSGAKQGDTLDLLVLNELVHVDRWPVNETHMNNAAKLPRSVVIISTNAGVKGTPAEKWRNEAIGHPERWWKQIYTDIAPWTSREDVAEAKRLDPIGAQFDRLWRGIWISGIGDAVSEEAIEACFELGDKPLSPRQGWLHLMALDMGETHDHAGAVVLAVHPQQQRIEVARAKGWEPSLPNDQGKLEVDEELVSEWCLATGKRYAPCFFGYDPAAGGRFIAQRLRKAGLPMREMTFSAANCTAMATAFVQTVNGGVLKCYEDDEGRLRRDFGKFSIKRTPPSKYKLEAVSDQHGHADVGTALVICLPRAVELLGGVLGLQPDDDVAYTGGGEEPTPEELEGWDEGLRDIYEMYDEPPEYGGRGRKTDRTTWHR